MKPIPGQIYAGRSGKPRKVAHLEDGDVLWKPVLRSSGLKRLGTMRRSTLKAWEAWVRGPISEHQA